MSTSLENQIKILANLADEVSEDNLHELADWVAWHNVSVPVANLISMGVFEINPVAERHIRVGFERLLQHLEKTDTGFDTLSDLLA